MEEIMSVKKPTQRSTRICLRPDLVEELNNLHAKNFDRSSRFKSLAEAPPDTRYQEAIEALQAEIEEATVTFVFQGVGRRNFELMMQAHPPTDEQQERHKADTGEDLVWNTDTFPPALVAASSLTPKISKEEAVKIFEDWDGPDLLDIFNAAFAANQSKVNAPFFKRDIGEILSSDSSLITALNEESPIQSS
jgi:hypothetical protein